VATVSFNKVVAGQITEPLDWEIPSGRFTVVTGPRGSGKSSVLRAVAGLEKVSAGEICIDDKPVNQLPPKNRDVAMVFTNDSLYPQMTAGENIAFGLKRRRFAATEIKKRTDEAVTILAIANLLGQRPRELSFAQQQRVAIARAVVRQPKVFLLDHALAGLDDERRSELRKDIIMLHERLRVTTLFATADIYEAMSMGDVLAVFDQGRLQASGAPRALHEIPDNLCVAKFLGHPPMNFFEGELRKDRNALRFHEAGGGTIQFDVPSVASLESNVNQPIVLGIRPENIEVAEFSRAKEQQRHANFRAITESVSPFGGGTDIYFHTGAHSGICGSSAWLSREEAGRRMEFVVNLEKAHFFDKSSEKRIA
jgi:multiple sugar transport system ATP-binding protein